jgi:hypothetical protein
MRLANTNLLIILGKVSLPGPPISVNDLGREVGASATTTAMVPATITVHFMVFLFWPIRAAAVRMKSGW